MHMHKFEKLWLIFGVASLLVFLSVLGVSAFHHGHHASSWSELIDPEKVDETEPFDEPGLKKVEGKDWDYELVFVASAFSYQPNEVQIPLGSTVKIIATTKDVIHGFQIPGSNINMMLEPGYVSEYIATLNQAGEFLVLCNEYCGAGHHLMTSKIEVIES
ncbi:cytochrome c oxidase subunit II [Cytobacillus horneckiae]|uniref:Cytochrome aa3 subunit 2 n=1 Tax=Cytobacillus horneckiae TaxID=549687 RepID=A0A2N0ZCP0_9BACI|nr:cytochrome c oxidase subunit II [Cytobacillus horneckiae]MCM3180274.1 cytochrome c oxidase subunit II [Cytobacillus horneckiae]MEC1156479.1 cytochrome c oxidase subunit II [Cytobacillus horneckiae]MED2940798.1 cytochrome c oxidase subunit II [Cytobacillus horneckiae]PKG27268.1 cytochrome B5 [Cytobacillus horneckiae]